jgi:hypothetical protein
MVIVEREKAMKKKLFCNLLVVLMVLCVVYPVVAADTLISDNLDKSRSATGTYYNSVTVTDGRSTSSVDFTNTNRLTASAVGKNGFAKLEYNFTEAAISFFVDSAKIISSEFEMCMYGSQNKAGSKGWMGYILDDGSVLPLIKAVTVDAGTHEYRLEVNCGDNDGDWNWAVAKEGLSNTTYAPSKVVYANGRFTYYINNEYVGTYEVEYSGNIVGLFLGAENEGDITPSKARFRNLTTMAKDVDAFSVVSVVGSDGSEISKIGLDESIAVNFSTMIRLEDFLDAVIIDENIVEDSRLAVSDDLKSLIIAAPSGGWEQRDDMVLELDYSNITDIYGSVLSETEAVIFGADGPLVYVAADKTGFYEDDQSGAKYMKIHFNARNLSEDPVDVSVILLECVGNSDKYYVAHRGVSEQTLGVGQTNIPIEASIEKISDLENVFYKALVWNKHTFDVLLTEPVLYFE